MSSGGSYDDDVCDYCYEATATHLVPVGFTTLEEGGPRLPLIKTWCGSCPMTDTVDLEARAAILAVPRGVDTPDRVTRGA